MAPLRTFWEFGRPHTLIGTSASVVGLYVLSLVAEGWSEASVVTEVAGAGIGIRLVATLVACQAANVFIVGLNQVVDEPIDRINKAWLPLPSGGLRRQTAMLLVGASGVAAAGIGAALSEPLFYTVFLSMLIGAAYSVPPLYLKRWPAAAAACIAAVRGPIVNFGLFAHFRHWAGESWEPTATVVNLAVFMALFSLGIAVLKDVPDVAGDREFGIMTLAVHHGPRYAFRVGLAGITAAYVVVLLASAGSFVSTGSPPSLGGGWTALLMVWHISALSWLRRRASNLPHAGTTHGFAIEPADTGQASRFYALVWRLVYAEYVVVPGVALLAARS